MPSPGITIPTPGPRWISFISLVLRATVGLQLFRIAISSYLARAAFGQSQRMQAFLLPPAAPNVVVDVFEYAILALSLALILGFFTRIAAAAIGVLFAAAILIQIALEIRAGVPAGLPPNPLQAIDALHLVQIRQHLTIQLVIILWLAGVSTNLYSLDGLMFLNRRPNDRPRPRRNQDIEVHKSDSGGPSTKPSAGGQEGSPSAP